MPPFKKWLKEVDFHLESKVGLSSQELPDAPWYDFYDSGMSPVEAIAEYAEEWDDTGMMEDII